MRIVLFIFAFALGAFLGYGLRPYTYKGISVDEAARFLSARDIKVSKEKEMASGAGYIRAEVRATLLKFSFFNVKAKKIARACCLLLVSQMWVGAWDRLSA